MNKNVWKSVVAVVCFTIILAFLVMKAQGILERKTYIEKYTPFFEEKQNFDVLFLGSSHMQVSVSPLDLWHDYGIASYNFGNPYERMPVTYWTMENAITCHRPKVVVVDVYSVNVNEKYPAENVDSVHNSWDCFPLTITKVKAVNDIVNDYKTRIEFLFTIGKYHSRWNELSQYAFEPLESKEKGLQCYEEDAFLIVDPQKQNLITMEKVEPEEDMLGVMYLRRLIESCKKKGIEVLLVYMPYAASEDEQMSANSVADIAKEYGVSYLNFVQMDSVIDMQTDLYNMGHVNASGMRKITDYLGKYLVNHYVLSDKRGEESYAGWNQDYEDYMNLKAEAIARQTNLYSLLMLLHDESLNSNICIKPESALYEDKIVADLMQNIAREHIFEETDDICKSGDMQTLKFFPEAAKTGEGYFLTVDNDKKQVQESLGRANIESDIEITVENKYTGEIVSRSKWTVADVITRMN